MPQRTAFCYNAGETNGLTMRPETASRMPMIKPPTEIVSKKFFIEPPAPPCEDQDRYPVLSGNDPAKKVPSK